MDNDSARALAGTWFEKGAKLVDNEQYVEALAAFRCSLKMVEHPHTIFNAAQAARLSGNLKEALRLFTRYVELSPSGNVSRRAKGIIREIREELKAKGEVSQEEPDELLALDTEHEETETERQSEDKPTNLDASQITEKDRDSRLLPNLGYASIGLGGALAVGGAVMQGLAATAVADGEQTDDYRGEWLELEDKRKGYQAAAVVGFISGGILAALGGGLLIFDAKAKSNGELALLPSPGGLMCIGAF